MWQKYYARFLNQNHLGSFFFIRCAPLKLEKNSFPFSNNFASEILFHLYLLECDRNGFVRCFVFFSSLALRIVFCYLFVGCCLHGRQLRPWNEYLERYFCWFCSRIRLFLLWQEPFSFLGYFNKCHSTRDKCIIILRVSQCVFGMRTYVAYVSDDYDDHVYVYVCTFVRFCCCREYMWKHFGSLFECTPPAFD